MFIHVNEIQYIPLTVRSLINVDLPAPFGPTIPTRLQDREKVQCIDVE